MTEETFWRVVRTSTPYGKYHSAHITSRGYDYNEESSLEEGPCVAESRLFDKLKSMGHIEDDKASESKKQRREYMEMKSNSMNIEHNGLD